MSSALSLISTPKISDNFVIEIVSLFPPSVKALNNSLTSSSFSPKDK